MKSQEFLTPNEEKQIVEAIKKAEKDTSGEIRVHLEKGAKKSGRERAVEVFHLLGMHQTKEKNGVLIYIDISSKSFTILGDKGIDQKVPDDFWESVKEIMHKHFKEGDYAQGLTKAIAEISVKLKKYFPYRDDDVNELSDDISKNY